MPNFDGNNVTWKSFWDQFCVSMHSKSKLLNTEKLAYPKHALKNGSARHVVEGLSGSSDYYEEVVDCLQRCLDWPHLLHKDMFVQSLMHLHLGMAMEKNYDTYMMLSTNTCVPWKQWTMNHLGHYYLHVGTKVTMFEWQSTARTPWEFPTIWPYWSSSIYGLKPMSLSFLMLAAKRQVEGVRGKRAQPVTSYVTGINDICVICKPNKHPLYACRQFKSLSHDQMVSILKDNNLCMNCLRPDHFVIHCTSNQMCRKCQKPHHTLLHLKAKSVGCSLTGTAPLPIVPTSSAPPNSSSSTLPSHITQTALQSCQILLMT